MIRVERRNGGTALVGAPADAVSYVDRDWIPSEPGPVASISARADGFLSWCDWPPVPFSPADDEDRVAALAVLGIARAAAAAVAELPPSVVDVVGTGVVAQLVKRLVGAREHDERPSTLGRPRGIVETTGAPGAIARATRRLEDLGLLVLAADRPGSALELNLYPDVHSRGLTLVGVSPPGDGTVVEAAAGDDDLVLQASSWLAHVPADAALPPDARWFRLSV